jgi:O-antigen ligase
MTSNQSAPLKHPRLSAFRPRSGPKKEGYGIAPLVLFVPIAIYLGSLWVLVPLPFPYATPLLLLLAPLFVKVSRRYVIGLLARLWLEFSLLLLMAFLAVLSLQNSDEPFRSFRVIFPCLVPFLLFAHFMVLGFVSRRHLLGSVRILLVAAFLLSVLPFLASYAVPPLKGIVWEEYRLRGFFQVSIQHGIALGTMVPLMVAEYVMQKRLVLRIVLLALLLLLAYTTFRAGSKTSMSIGFAMGLVTYAVLKIRSQSALRSLGMFFGIGFLGLFLSLYGLDLAEKLEPETGEKLRNIVEGGAATYQSVQVRRNLWQLALEEGKAHWLVGAGAGKVLLGYPHAHNLVIDYFKNIGLFGAVAVAALCLIILFRAGRKTLAMLSRGGDDEEKRIFACYMAAVVYVLANQMSDSFGPSTIGFLWSVYLVAVIADYAGSLRRVRGLPQ